MWFKRNLTVVLLSSTLPLLALGSLSSAILNGELATNTQASGDPAVAQYIAVGDVDNDGVAQFTDTLPTNGIRKLFYLNHRPVQRLINVKVNSVVLNQYDPATHSTRYYYDLETGWITLRTAYTSGDTVEVEYEHSDDLDIYVTNLGEPPPFGQKNTLHYNEGDFDLDSNVSNDVGWGRARNAQLIDYDRDGDVDTHQYLFMHTNGLLGAPATTFQHPPSDHSFVHTYVENTYGDIDGDGLLDYIQANGEPELFRSTVGGDYRYYWAPDTAPYPSHLEFFDYDNDGDADVLMGTNQNTSQGVVIYRQDVTQGPFIYISHTKNSGNPSADGGRIDRYLNLNPGDLTYVSTVHDDIPSNYAAYATASNDDYFFIATDWRIQFRAKDEMHTFITEFRDDQGGRDWSELAGIQVDGNFLYVVDRGYQSVAGDGAIWRYQIGVDTLLLPPLLIDGGLDCFQDLYIDDTHIYYTCDDHIRRKPLADLGQFPDLHYGHPFLPGFFSTLWGITGDDDFIYVTDYDDHALKKLAKATFAASMPPVDSFSGPGIGDDDLRWPVGVTMDDNYVYVGDGGNSRIMVLDKTNLNFVTKIQEINGNHNSWEHLYYTDDAMGPDNMIFRQVWESPDPADNEEVRAADFDNDGDLDIVAFSKGPSVGSRIYRNDGVDISSNPIFTQTWEQPSISDVVGGDVGDIDKDGNMDIILVNESSSPIVQVFLGNGAGGMTYEWGSNLAGGTYNDFSGGEVKLADLDGDSMLDAVASAQAPGSHTGMVVFSNEGFSGTRMTRVRATTEINGQTVTIEARFIVDGGNIRLISQELK